MAKNLAVRDIIRDPNNLNSGNGESGQALIDKSVNTVGWGRSMVMASDGVMLAGNHALKKAQKDGVEPIYVESDGDRPVIVVRKDLKSTDKKARLLGILDNKTQQNNLRFDNPRVKAELESLNVAPAEVGFTDAELSMPAGEAGDAGPQQGSNPVGCLYQVVVEVGSEAEQAELFERLTNDGFTCRTLNL